MEITKEGINKEKWRINGICPRCRAGLAIGYKDICMFATDGYWTSKVYFATKCCACGEKLKIPKWKIPSIIRQAILNEMNGLDILHNFFR